MSNTIGYFFLFWPIDIFEKAMCHDQHLCHPRVGRNRHKEKGELGMAYYV